MYNYINANIMHVLHNQYSTLHITQLHKQETETLLCAYMKQDNNILSIGTHDMSRTHMSPVGNMC